LIVINAVTLLRRRPGLSVDEFRRHWRHDHAALIARLPGIARYVQSRPLDENPAGGEPVCDGFAELWVRDSQALRAISASAAYAAVLADEEHFLDRAANTLVVTDEHILRDGAVSEADIKRIRFFKRSAGLAVEEFQSRWRERFGPLAAALPSLRRYAQYHTRLGGYSQGRQPAWDGFDMTWFASTEAMRSALASPTAARCHGCEPEFLAAAACPVLLARDFDVEVN
jgi:uncharacterized protein (TIGR02118 family)